MTFEEELDRLFNDAVDIYDTVWYSDTKTLRDAIMELYMEYHEGKKILISIYPNAKISRIAELMDFLSFLKADSYSDIIQETDYEVYI